MAQGVDPVSADLKSLQQSLTRYPDIQVIISDDFASNYFEVEYSLKGFIILPDKSIVQDKSHRIAVTLPFGYPHFAPTIRPLTPIFHPDIDPDAIRIADFWEDNKSLEQLMVYIGKMICAEIYNVESPFNLDAAEWFLENIHILPIDTIQEIKTEKLILEKSSEPDADNDIEETFSIGPGSNFDSDAEDDEDTSIDNLFSDLGVEDDSVDFTLDQVDIDADELVEPDQQAISLSDIKMQMLNSKYFHAQQLLAKLDEDTNEIERSVIEEEIQEAINDANEIYSKIEEYEQKGKLREAKSLVDQLAQLVTDFPNFKDIKARVRGNFALTMSMKLQAKKKERTPASQENFLDLDADIEEEAAVEKKTDKKKKKKKKFTFSLPSFPKKKATSGPKKSLPIKSILAGIIILAIAGTGGYLYFKDSSSLSKANSLWLQAQKLATQKEYGQSKKTAEDALAQLEKILFPLPQKAPLQKFINTLLSSKTFAEGIQGRVLYNGEYISSELADNLSKLDALLKDAEQLYTQEKVKEAIAKFIVAQQFAKSKKLETQASSIGQKLNHLNLEDTLANARVSEQRKEWDSAADTYVRALEFARKLSDPKNESAINKQLSAAKFRKELSQSKETFAESQWKQTLEILQRAEEQLLNNPSAVSKTERTELEHLRHNSELYQILNTAGTAYRQKKWNKSILEYEKGLKLLRDNKDSFGKNQQSSIRKIKKTLLMIKVSVKLNIAAQTNEEKDLVAAVAHYKELTTMINESEFSSNKELKKVLTSSKTQIDSANEQIDIDDKTQWLTDNFKRIFVQFYPSSRSSELTSPKVTLLKKMEDTIIFKLSCVEYKQGRSFRLKLDYQYSYPTDSWNIYSGEW